MYGLIVTMTAIPDAREELIRILMASGHDARLSSASISSAVRVVRWTVSSVDKIAVTTPVWGVDPPPERVKPSPTSPR